MKLTFQKITMLLCCLVLLLSLTGCERADYVAAVEVYNNGDFVQAREMFLVLGEYEDSAALAKRCDYHLALQIYKDGKFEDAIKALEKLGDYEDCRELITHCRYQIALQLLESKDYDAAQAAFEALDGYERSQEHIADICWARLYDHVIANGTPLEDGFTYRITAGEDPVPCILADSRTPDRLTLFTEYSRDEGFVLYDSLAITVQYKNPQAEFTAVSKFTLSWKGEDRGSTQTCTGHLELATIGENTVLPMENYKMESVDIQGESSVSYDVESNSMEEAMATNYAALYAAIDDLLQSMDARFTVSLLGFGA